MAFNIANYTLIKDRLKEFRSEYEGCTISTELLKYEPVIDTSTGEACNECLFKATVTPNPLESPEIYYTGHAAERDNSGFVNKSSAIENCETSAVGRALAYAGFGGDEQFASAEEVINAKIHQAKSSVTVDMLDKLDALATKIKDNIGDEAFLIYRERRSSGFYDTKVRYNKTMDYFIKNVNYVDKSKYSLNKTQNLKLHPLEEKPKKKTKSRGK